MVLVLSKSGQTLGDSSQVLRGLMVHVELKAFKGCERGTICRIGLPSPLVMNLYGEYQNGALTAKIIMDKVFAVPVAEWGKGVKQHA